MIVYKLNKQTNEILETFENATSFEPNNVMYLSGKYPAKTYANDEEYFTDILPIIEEGEVNDN